MLTIDINRLNTLGISVGEYLYLLQHFDKSFNLDIDYEKLKSLGYVDSFGVTNKAAKDVYTSPISDTVDFIKVYDLYPHKVDTRVLKSKSHDSENYAYCLNKFKFYVRKDPYVSAKMYKGLSNEIELRRRGNSEKFFQDIKTWFNQRTWEKYCELDIQEENTQNYDVG
jgi:hypothetical protein